MNFFEYLKTLIERFVGGSFERMRIIQEMNISFKEMFYSGEIEYFCKISVGLGETAFKHEMSAFVFRSGFKVTVENDSSLKQSDMRKLASYICENKPFVRQLLTLGFDTLIVAGKTTNQEHRYELKRFTSIYNYMIE